MCFIRLKQHPYQMWACSGAFESMDSFSHKINKDLSLFACCSQNSTRHGIDLDTLGVYTKTVHSSSIGKQIKTGCFKEVSMKPQPLTEVDVRRALRRRALRVLVGFMDGPCGESRSSIEKILWRCCWRWLDDLWFLSFWSELLQTREAPCRVCRYLLEILVGKVWLRVWILRKHVDWENI